MSWHRMRVALLSAALLLGRTPAGHAEPPATFTIPPFTATSTTIFAEAGTGLKLGSGSTFLVQSQFNCPSVNGCVVLADVDVLADVFSSYKICSKLDGTALQPYCELQSSATGGGHQISALSAVAFGAHSLKTYVETGGKVTLKTWRAVYTVYGM